MKITLTEYEGCFALDFTAESVADAALLVRFNMNRTDQINHASACANKDGTISGGLVFAASKRANNDIPRRR